MTKQLPPLFLQRLSAIIPPNRIFADDLRCFAYGTDASFYRLTPQLIIEADSEDEVSNLLRLCSELHVPLTFRGAGTSLSGQAVTDSVLMTLSPRWRKVRILDRGERIAMQPGVIGSHANLALSPYGYKIGPDPASIQSAMIGGIAANNASGMCCGVKFNSYHTLQTMRVILSDGTLLDTSDMKSVENFKIQHPALVEGLSGLAKKVMGNPELKNLIRHKYSIKNTTGYSINALTDYLDSIEILQHLMIGSEGTLGFISEITLKTIPVKPFRAVGLAVFKDLQHCVHASVDLSRLPNIQALELMDDKSLLAVSKKRNFADILPRSLAGTAALLIETAGDSTEEIKISLSEIERRLSPFELLCPAKFSSAADVMDHFWSVRKGLFPSVGAMRQSGSTVVIEDICVPLNVLDQAVMKVKQLFERLDYRDAVLFGHIRDGNLHMVFSQKFDTPLEIARYRELMARLTYLISVEFGGSLKAEHGTGRNMAPFVEKEWGSAAYGLMVEIKRLLDPLGILNPGVLLNQDSEVHLKNLKSFEESDPLIDGCVECGFCEPVCPSKDLTLTPRQRIAVSREIARLEKSGDYPGTLESMKHDFQYWGEKTCAADGLCGTVCPVDIDTGAYIKSYRALNKPTWQVRIADFAADHFSFVTGVVGFGLRAADFIARWFGDAFVEGATAFAHKITGGKIPVWYRECPIPSERITKNSEDAPVNISAEKNLGYFPSCVSRTMGKGRKDSSGRSLPRAVLDGLKMIGIRAQIPSNVESLCCGLVFSSKGFPRQAEEMRTKALNAMSALGTEQVLCDVSPCAQWLKEGSAQYRFQVLDSIEVIHNALNQGDLQLRPIGAAVIHSVCSVKKMDLESNLKNIAKKLVQKPIFPYNGCCGFSGDKGLFTPELSQSALSQMSVDCSSGTAGYTTSPTCGIAMSQATGISHQSLFHLVLQCGINN